MSMGPRWVRSIFQSSLQHYKNEVQLTSNVIVLFQWLFYSLVKKE